MGGAPAPTQEYSQLSAASVAPEPRSSNAVRRLAWLLDDIVRIPGTRLRLGIDPLLGLIPGGGDLAGGALSAWIIVSAARSGAPPAVLVRMGLNVIVDALVGTVPLLGDLFDAGWKANRRNAALLEEYVGPPRPVVRQSRAVLVLVLLAVGAVIIGAALLGIAIVRWIIAQL